MKKSIRTLVILSVMTIIVLASAICANAATDKKYTIKLANGKTTTVEGHFETKLADQIMKDTNSYRKSKKLNTLKSTSTLKKISETRAIEASYKFSHTRPCGKKCFSISSVLRGENLACGYKTSAAVMKAWKASKSHNKNLTYKTFKTLSVSVFAKKNVSKSGRVSYTYYIAQSFGK